MCLPQEKRLGVSMLGSCVRKEHYLFIKSVLQSDSITSERSRSIHWARAHAQFGKAEIVFRMIPQSLWQGFEVNTQDSLAWNDKYTCPFEYSCTLFVCVLLWMVVKNWSRSKDISHFPPNNLNTSPLNAGQPHYPTTISPYRFPLKLSDYLYSRTVCHHECLQTPTTPALPPSLPHSPLWKSLVYKQPPISMR